MKSNSSPQALISKMHICVRCFASDSGVFSVPESLGTPNNRINEKDFQLDFNKIA